VKVLFKSTKFKKICDDERKLNGVYGKSCAKKLKHCLGVLKAIETLSDISNLKPLRCHELSGNHKGRLSVDLDHPYRLLFRPDHEPIPSKPDGGLDRTKVTAVVIIGIEDTHGA
jgi:plasmid maintenance system killer protein